MLMDEVSNHEKKDFKYSPTDSPKEVELSPASSDTPSVAEENVENPLFKWSSPDSFSSNKTLVWYLSLLVITLGVAAGIYFITKDKITTTVILVSGLLIGFYGAKKPRMVNYEINRSGFSVNGRYYRLSNYRSFAVINHGDGRNLILTPLKRFMPYMYIYCDKTIEPKISSLLSEVMPSETTHRDGIDRFLRKIGF